MTQPFTLYLPDDDSACWLDADGAVAHGTPRQAAEAAQGNDALVLVPGETILLTEVKLPPIRQAARRLQAARYALEEQLAARVDTLHFALADQARARSIVPVATTDIERMDRLMTTLTDAGLHVVRVAPDVLALPEPDAGAWHVCALGQRILVRTGRHTGFACEPALWPALAAGAQEPPQRLVVDADSQAAADAIGAADLPGTPEVEQRPLQTPDRLREALLANSGTRVSVNLCQGEFIRSSGMQRWWEPFKLTAALAAVWLVLLLGARGVESYQLHHRIDILHERGISAFRNAFPEVRNINNLRVQAEQKMAALRSGGATGGVYSLLQATAEVTTAATGLTVQTLQYRDGELILSLTGDSVQSLEALRAGFERQPHVRLTVERADAAGGGVRIRASVSPA